VRSGSPLERENTWLLRVTLNDLDLWFFPGWRVLKEFREFVDFINRS